jgi:outer membrane protein OmpA-like peptidoglycan-associated protein
MRAATIAIVAACAGLVACGASAPSKELKTARDTYNKALVSPAAQYSPSSVLEAKQALDVAERAHDDEPGSDLERSFAYIATRRSEEAMVQGDLAMAKRDKEMADQRYLTLQEEIRTKQERELASRRMTDSELQAANAQLEQERGARRDAELRAQRAMESLERSASVKEEARGTVITLSGQVLFLTGKDTLLPAAREKLADVASVLAASSDDRKILIEGHTDSQGAEEMNLKLSERRAESVKDYLVSQGVPEDRIRTEGKGESNPIADNNSPEGRANNRRVEIVMERSSNQQRPGSTNPESPGMERGKSPQDPNMPQQATPPGGNTNPQGTPPQRKAPRARPNGN